MSARLLRTLFVVTFLLVWLSTKTATAQTTDYLYGIEQGNTPELDVMAISVNAGGTATSFINSQVVNLSSITGFNALPGGSQNIVYNGLALDPSNNTLFFTVSYNTNGNPTQGTFTADTYAVQNLWGTWHATQIFNLTQASGLADNPGVNNTSATPASTTLSDGWFTKGAFYQGSYYVGVDGDVKSGTQNSLYQIKLGNGDTSSFDRPVDLLPISAMGAGTFLAAEIWCSTQAVTFTRLAWIRLSALRPLPSNLLPTPKCLTITGATRGTRTRLSHFCINWAVSETALDFTRLIKATTSIKSPTSPIRQEQPRFLP